MNVFTADPTDLLYTRGGMGVYQLATFLTAQEQQGVESMLRASMKAWEALNTVEDGSPDYDHALEVLVDLVKTYIRQAQQSFRLDIDGWPLPCPHYFPLSFVTGVGIEGDCHTCLMHWPTTDRQRALEAALHGTAVAS